MKSGFSQSEVSASRDADSSAALKRLTDARIPAQDLNFYSEGIRRGGTLVIVQTDNSKAQQAADILSRYNMVDVDGQVLQVIEEELQIGKRQVQSGGVRIHSFVTERPVEEQVTLRDETVHIERHPASG